MTDTPVRRTVPARNLVPGLFSPQAEDGTHRLIFTAGEDVSPAGPSPTGRPWPPAGSATRSWTTPSWGHDRRPPPHPRLPHLQEAARLLGRREGPLPPRVRGDRRRQGHHLLDRRGRIRRLPRPQRRRQDDDPQDALGAHLSHLRHGARRRLRPHRSARTPTGGSSPSSSARRTSSGGTFPPASRSPSCARSTASPRPTTGGRWTSWSRSSASATSST